MTKIKKITQEDQFLTLNSIKRIIAQPSIELYPLLYKDNEIMYSEQFINRIYKGTALEAFGYYKDSDMLGYIIVEWMQVYEKGALKAREFAYIHDLGTLPEVKGQDVATKLLKHVEELMLMNRVSDIELAVHIDFKEAISLYEHLGFKPRTLRLHKSIK
jgi:ribosomal protein S18 acetylase RimI-like enzyme